MSDESQAHFVCSHDLNTVYIGLFFESLRSR